MPLATLFSVLTVVALANRTLADGERQIFIK
jgi:hypothetical protein